MRGGTGIKCSGDGRGKWRYGPKGQGGEGVVAYNALCIFPYSLFSVSLLSFCLISFLLVPCASVGGDTGVSFADPMCKCCGATLV